MGTPKPRYAGLSLTPSPSMWGLSSDMDLDADAGPSKSTTMTSKGGRQRQHQRSASSSAATFTSSGTVSRQPSSSLRRRGRPWIDTSTPRNGSQPASVTSTSTSQYGAHPLASLGESPEAGPSDISRPTLRRLTSETERRLEDAGLGMGMGKEASERESNVGGRGSEDTVWKEGAGEVEVLIHQVKANESLAGIALLYGIDLATLRKTNKLWPSDPVHLHTRLYVPLDACRWNKASETLVRGPGEGQVTLIAKAGGGQGVAEPQEGGRVGAKRTSRPGGVERWSDGLVMGNGKGPEKGKARDAGDSHDRNGHRRSVAEGEPGFGLHCSLPRSASSGLNEYEEWGDGNPHFSDVGDPEFKSPHSTRSSQEASSPDTDFPRTRILDVVRIPSSQLRFFPRPQKPDSSRSSFDSDLRRTSLSLSISLSRQSSSTPSSRGLSSAHAGPAIHHDLSTLPGPLHIEPKHKANTVRIRPPSAVAPSSGTGLANRLSALFVVPPPPLPGVIPPPRAKARVSMESARSSGVSSPRRSRKSSLASSPGQSGGALDELEMQVHSRGSMETLRETWGNGNERLPDVHEGKKLD